MKTMLDNSRKDPKQELLKVAIFLSTQVMECNSQSVRKASPKLIGFHPC
jgi:hypothetical protein